jgi:hypothetical protein
LNCRIRVVCGAEIIYGRDTGRSRYGFAQCQARTGPAGQQVLEAHDANPTGVEGDPRMDIDTGAGQIVVSDDGPSGSWTVAIDFAGAAGASSAIPPGPRTSI